MSNLKKILLIFVISTIFVISCSNKNVRAENSFTSNLESEPESLDPQSIKDVSGYVLADKLYEGLVRLDEKSEIIPAGAESWKVSQDGKVWTFNIRKGMKWSNGDVVTAHDYVRGMKRGLEPATAAAYSFIMYYIKNAKQYNEGELKDFEKVGIKAKDDYTLEITLEKPVAFFGKTLITPIYLPANEKAVNENKEKYGAEATTSVYNGPYILKEWNHDNKIVLEKNPNYWDAKNIKSKRINLVMVTDMEASTNLFKNKEVDFARLSLDKINEFRGKPELKTYPDGRVWYLAFNSKNPILKNKKIRQALALAINRDELVSDILNGVGIKASGLVAKGFPGVVKDFREENGDLYAQYKNVDLKKLFEEGLKEEKITPDKVKLTLTVDDRGSGKKEAEFYQAQWQEKLGINVNVQTVTYKEMITRAEDGNFDILRNSWGADYVDAMTYLELFVTSSGLNSAKFSNSEYDRLVAFAQESIDKKARIEAMEKAEKILADNFVYSGLYFQVGTYLQNTKLEGMIIRAAGNSVDFYKAYLKD